MIKKNEGLELYFIKDKNFTVISDLKNHGFRNNRKFEDVI